MGAGLPREAVKARRGVDVAGGAYGDEEVAAGEGFFDGSHMQGDLTEPDDVGP